MKNASPEFDAYITDAPAYAKPILTKLRALFHKACPDIEEVMKWSFPHFEYRGIVANMAAFKNYVRWGFWKAALMSDLHSLFEAMGDTTMGATKAATVDDLPSDKILIEYIREAVALNEKGVKVRARKKRPPKPVEVPEYFLTALKKNKKALAAFEAFSPSHKREYIDWITEAKQEATRQQRLATAIEWIAEAKPRHWKYMKR
jgi:uncharacterized protein YdeI (YjbR/CyaY-like superfamily)